MTAPIDDLLFHRRHRRWTLAALTAIVAVGVVDYLTGPEITFSVFYLVPVAVAAWLSGTAVAIAASALAAFAWLVAEAASSRLDANVLVYAWNFCARLLFLLLVALLLARLREMLERERVLSRTDPLTGLLNARSFREVAAAEILRARRYAQPLSLAFIDIDDFKRVNDSRGHAAGDLLLTQMAELIRSNLRGSDIVARYGGDEFVILLPYAGEDAARVAVGKLVDRVNEAANAHRWPVTLSAGVVTCLSDPPSVDFLLESADRLMYEVKSGAKKGVRFAVAAPAATPAGPRESEAATR